VADGHAGGGAYQTFLAAAAEDERITAFEPEHAKTPARMSE
jgi:hypothetical protein